MQEPAGVGPSSKDPGSDEAYDWVARQLHHHCSNSESAVRTTGLTVEDLAVEDLPVSLISEDCG